MSACDNCYSEIFHRNLCWMDKEEEDQVQGGQNHFEIQGVRGEIKIPQILFWNFGFFIFCFQELKVITQGSRWS